MAQPKDPSILRWSPSLTIDCSSIIPAPSASLIRSLAPNCVCFHPEKPLLAVGVSGYVAVYDLLTGSRLGRTDLNSMPVEMCFAPDGSALVVVVQDWVLYSVTLSSFKCRILVPKRTKMDKPLESCLLAVAPGYTPFVYFCRFGKDVLRSAQIGRMSPKEAQKDTSWGLRVKLDVQKAVLGLACHYLDQQLLVLMADGQLHGYAISGSMGEVLSPMWALAVCDPVDKVLPAEGSLSVVAHPSVSGGALLLQSTRLGSVCVLEAVGRAAPSVVIRTRMVGWAATLGLGLHRDTAQILVFGLTDGGKVRSGAWRMAYRSLAPGITLAPQKVEPADLVPLLDPAKSRHRPPPPPPVTAPSSQPYHAYGNGPSACAGSYRGSFSGIPGVMGASGKVVGAGGGWDNGAAAAMCQSLWSPSVSWSADSSGTMLLEPQLGPLVLRVLVHPTLGCAAMQLEPSFMLQANSTLGLTPAGQAGPEELALARRTASVPLLRLVSSEPHHTLFRGALCSAQTTPLSAWAWQPADEIETEPGPEPAHSASTDQQQQQQVSQAGSHVSNSGGGGISSAGGMQPGRGDFGASSMDGRPSMDKQGSVRNSRMSLAGGASRAVGSSTSHLPDALRVPPHVYYISTTNCQLIKYSLVTRVSSPLAVLPAESENGGVRMPRQLVHGARSGAWLVFFEDTVPPGTPADKDLVRWHWALLTGDALAHKLTARQGKHGCFVGPRDEHLVIITQDGKLAALFDVATASNPSTMPLLSFALDSAVVPPGLSSPLFPGPPLTHAPLADPEPNPDAPITGARRMRSHGVLLWQTAEGCLAMTTMPSLSFVPLDDGDSSSDEDESGPVASQQLPPQHHFGTLTRSASLQLQQGESVLQVSWQALAEGAAMAAVHQALNPAKVVRREGVDVSGRITPSVAAAAATACAGAILTSQRLLLVKGDLTVLACVDLATAALGGLAVPCTGQPVSSLLWAGPMLLYTTPTGRVQQMTWTGGVHTVATLSGNAGHLSLLGTTADALILLRSAFSNHTASMSAPGSGMAGSSAGEEVVVRPAALLQPLLLGWTSLAAAGLLPGGGSQARGSLQAALKHWDTGSVTPKGLWGLLAAGAWDVAAAIANYSPLPLDPNVKLAANAAAGRWSEVAAALESEQGRSLHAPGPPPRGGALHGKMCAAARGALLHGQLGKASELLQAAGEWRAAMVLAVCQGNAAGAYGVAQRLSSLASSGAGGVSSEEAAEAGRLAGALRGLYGGVGQQLGDVRLTLVGPEPGAGAVSTASGWEFAAPHAAAPATVTVAGTVPKQVLTPAELGLVAPAPRTAVPSYLGLFNAATTALSAAAVGGGDVRAAGHAKGNITSKLSTTSATPSQQQQQQQARDLATVSVASSADAAQAAARAEFFGFAGLQGAGGAGGPGISFSDSDDDTNDAESVASGAPKRTFQLRIRGRDEVAAGATGTGAPGTPLVDDGSALREAAKGLKMLPLPPPSAGPTGGIGFGPQVTGAGTAGAGQGLHAPAKLLVGGTTSAVLLGAGAAAGLGPAAGPTGASAAGPGQFGPGSAAGPTGGSGALPQFPPGISSAQLYAQGVTQMESGDWRGAAAHFSRAMSVLSNDEPLAPSTAQRITFCAHYYAAVRLLERATAGAGPREARLYRYLASLPLDERHRIMLLREAISRNKALRNYKYASEQLTTLITLVVSTAPTEFMAALQADMDECDRAGGSDSDVPRDEDLADWSALVGAAHSKEDVDLLVLPLI